MGKHGHIAIWYSRSEGGVVVPFREGIVALDELYVDAPGTRFAWGADIIDGTVRPAFDDIGDGRAAVRAKVGMHLAAAGPVAGELLGIPGNGDGSGRIEGADAEWRAGSPLAIKAVTGDDQI